MGDLNANRETLERLHKGQAEERFRELADLGGYGEVGHGQGQINIDSPGGLGILGALRDDNTAISEKSKDRMAEIMHIDRKKDIEQHVGRAIEVPKGKEER